METITKFLADQEAERERVWEAISLIEAIESSLLAEAERDYDDQVMTGRIQFQSTKAKRRG